MTGPGDTEGASGLPQTGAKAQQRRKLHARPGDEVGVDPPSGGWPRPGVSPLRPPEDSFPEPADYDQPHYDQYEPSQYEAGQQRYESYGEYEQRGYDQTGSFPRPGYPQYEPEQYGAEPPAPRQPEDESYRPAQFDGEHYDEEEDLPRVRGRRANAIRPYVRTGGRTRSNRELALETLVSVSRQRPRSARPPNREYRRVVDLCDVPRSIAEVAALTAVPVGVARVLVGDLAAQGLLTVHQTRGQTGAATDMALMQRVLAGLRKL